MNNKIKLYQVGGYVRDGLLKRKNKDLDYSVEASSYTSMKNYLESEGYQIFLEKPEFATIRAKSPTSKMTFDFVLCSTITEDLSKRDFTVNAMALDIESELLIDPYGGQIDLENNLLRCVISTHDRLHEDPLRSVRAIRFMVTHGFECDDSLWEALNSQWLPPMLSQIPKDRIREEIEKAFRHDTLKTLRILGELPESFRKVVFREIWLLPKTKKV